LSTQRIPPRAIIKIFKEEKAMLRIAKQTRLASQEVIDRAARFFGKGGEGLTETERNPCCISFDGAGGYVAVSISEEGGRQSVEVQTREFEYPVRRFLETI
jgi:hypothetical protein